MTGPAQHDIVAQLFTDALEESAAAFEALSERAAWDPVAFEALSAFVLVETERLEREGRLDPGPVSSRDQILAAVRDASAVFHRR